MRVLLPRNGCSPWRTTRCTLRNGTTSAPTSANPCHGTHRIYRQPLMIPSSTHGDVQKSSSIKTSITSPPTRFLNELQVPNLTPLLPMAVLTSTPSPQPTTHSALTTTSPPMRDSPNPRTVSSNMSSLAAPRFQPLRLAQRPGSPPQPLPSWFTLRVHHPSPPFPRSHPPQKTSPSSVLRVRNQFLTLPPPRALSQ